MARKPSIHKGPAANHEAGGEIVREFGDDRSGGLISIMRDSNDRLRVSLYRMDGDVYVVVPPDHTADGAVVTGEGT